MNVVTAFSSCHFTSGMKIGIKWVELIDLWVYKDTNLKQYVMIEMIAGR